MRNRFIFLRHGETIKDKTKPISLWDLTKEGRASAEALSASGIFDNIDIIISSGEPKAFQTAEPFANRLKKEIIQISGLNEIDRDKGGMLTSSEYEEMKKKIFHDFDYTAYGWETINSAMTRYEETLHKINQIYKKNKILIVSHGTVMSLHFAKVANQMDNIFDRWSKLGFCDYGIVEGEKILKDII